MLRMDQVCVVRHKVLVEKQSQRKVAHELGISRNTVSKYLYQSDPAYRQKSARTKPAVEKVRGRIDQLVEEWRGQVGGSATANILTGGVDHFFSRADSTGTVNPLRDALGSTIALSDSSGLAQTEYSYEPFGKTSSSGVPSANGQRYIGREEDGTGLYYYRARYYSPSLQRFISEDPIGLRGGINQYAYVGNNPISLRDPLGLKEKGNGSWFTHQYDKFSRWLYTGDGNAPDDVYRASMIASYNDLQQNSPIRGVFIFVGEEAGDIGGVSANGELLALGGFNIDDGLYAAIVAAGGGNAKGAFILAALKLYTMPTGGFILCQLFCWIVEKEQAPLENPPRLLRGTMSIEIISLCQLALAPKLTPQSFAIS